MAGKRDIGLDLHDPHRTAGQSSPWFIFSVVLLASMAGPVNYYKVPPLMPLLMAAYHLSGAEGGVLMSIFAVVGIALSIPSGFIVNTLGYRKAGILGVAWIAGGSGLGAVSTGAMALLATRLMEGVGLNLMAIVAPTVISAYFQGKKQSIAVGIWSVWYPLGSTITFAAAPLIASQWGWRSVWWFGCFYAAAAGILYFASIETLPAHGTEPDQEGQPDGGEMPGSRQTLLNRDVWKLSVMFLAFAFVYVSFVTWTPTFLLQTRGVSLSHAAFAMSLFSIVSLPATLASGYVYCADWPTALPPSPDYATWAQDLSADAPDFSILMVPSRDGCQKRPFAVDSTIGPLHAHGAPAILVIAATGDPATPYEWAEPLPPA